MLHSTVGCLCSPLLSPQLFLFLIFAGATVVTVVTAAVAVIVGPLPLFIRVDPASWLLFLWPCVNR